MVRAKKKSITWLAIIVLTLCAGIGVKSATAATTLTDVSGHQSYAEINYLWEKGVIFGDPDGAFRPDALINRAEMIAMLNRAFGFTDAAQIAFNDAEPSDWYYPDAAAAVKAGYISGFPDGSLGAYNSVTRQEAAAIMARIMKIDTSASLPATVTDAAAIPAWSKGSVAAMLGKGCMNTYGDGAFRPLLPISRADAAVLIYKCMKPPVPVTGVVLNRTLVVLYAGEGVTITATVRPASASNKSLIWSSSDKAVAVVDNNGKVTAVKEGLCIITVRTMEGGFEDTCRILVEETVRVKNVTLDESSIEIGVGQTFFLFGSIEPENATNQRVAWSSSDQSVATVSDMGRVKGVGEGTAIIAVETEDGGHYDTCLVTVTEGGYVNISLSSLTMYIDKTDPRTLYAYVRGDDSQILGVIWESDDEDVAKVEYDGLALQATVTAVGTGTCSVNIEVNTEEGEYHDSCKIVVLD